ncbi:hypothetical protein [Pseudomonas sp.]|uniref:hypothetical protein n=1 Tax=Pseudomonas sp. TaxID=306 RepID=UPI003FD7DA71
MAQVDSVRGEFSPVSGNNTRRVFDKNTGDFRGLIIKRSDGYLVQRLDGKTRIKKTLAAAFKSVARNN